jgi:Protein of unknown function (DUF3592)
MVKKLSRLLFSAFFAVAFGMGGLWAGVFPLVDTVKQAYQVRTWQSAQATINDVDLIKSRGSKGGTTYAVKAKYAYSFAGRSFNSTRLGLNEGSSTDNIGDWHQTWYQKLTDAKNNERTVLVWVNPDQPEQALLDRDVRWPMVLFRLPFALLFTAVGASAATVFVFLLVDLPVPFGSLWRNINRNAGPRSNKQGFVSTDLTMLWLLTFCWCSLSFPFAGLVWITNAGWLAKAVLTLFTGIGFALMYGAVKLSIERVKRAER